MPANPTDIAAASRDVVLAIWSSPTIAARYPSARDGSVTPPEGYCDHIGDAQAIMDARGALIGVERRRFAVSVHDLLWFDPTAGQPTVRLVDGEQRVGGNLLMARIEVDLETETTDLELFG